MRSHRGICVGACLLLAAAGCGTKTKPLSGGGTYSPIITTISSNFEPAARGTANVLTVQVTNVNGYPLKYHWMVQAGTLGADSTNASVTWTPPDSIATYDVTASIQTTGDAPPFFRTMTVHMAVDNEYIRWTHTDQVEFDPAPTANGGVVYAEYHNVSTGNSDAYRVDTPLGAPAQLTTGFFSVTSPTPRADQGAIAFMGKVNSSVRASIYQLPYGGGDASTAQVVERTSTYQTTLDSPRFPFEGDRLLFASDSIGTDGFNVQSGMTLRWHDSANLYTVAPVSVVEHNFMFNTLGTNLANPSWGPDLNSDGNPDSVMALGIRFPGTASEIVDGIYLFATPNTGDATDYKIWLPGVNLHEFDWSPDGNYVVFTQRNAGTNDRDIWIIRRGAASLSEARRVTSGPADDSQPRWSADGTKIFFISNRADRYGVTGVLLLERRGYNIWSVSHFDRP
ncbi:MAG: TolB family protein [Bacteroidota bacterium]